MPQFITFYSYKGGVGRSLALANIATSLAMKGRKVFLLDFDLEAPGLDIIMSQNSSKVCGEGIVEYIAEYYKNGTPPDSLSKYTNEIKIQHSLGSIRLMPSGKKDRAYQEGLCRLNWNDLYRKNNGFYFIENLKAQIVKEYSPDYVLIDSRTGLTDIGGVCTVHLPDMVVLLFSLNQQNIDGIKYVKNYIQSNPFKKDIKLLYVATPVPDITEIELDKKLKHVTTELDIKNIDALIHYNVGAALEENLVASENTHSILKTEYERISTKIIGANINDFENSLSEAKRLLLAGNSERAGIEFLQLYDLYRNNYFVCLEAAKALSSIGNYKAALLSAKAALKLLPTEIEPKVEIAKIYVRTNKKNKAKKILQGLPHNKIDQINPKHIIDVVDLYAKLNEYKKANKWLQIAANTASALNDTNLSWRMAELAMSTDNYQLAIKLYQKSQLYNTLPSIYNIGVAMYRLGDIHCTEYFKKSIALFEEDDLSSEPITTANKLQAIAFAYKYLGDYQQAEASLLKAKKIIAPYAKYNLTIFSPTLYKNVPIKQFMKENAVSLRQIKSLLNRVSKNTKNVT